MIPVIFKRRDKRGTGRMIRDSFYPPGGWGRGFNYLYHRLRRLPDPPHRIARGIAAGVFVTCSPFFGFHFLFAAGIAWLIRGNILASLLSTLVGNPVTFPFIGAAALGTGGWIMGHDTKVGFAAMTDAFRTAGVEIWWNIRSLFTDATAHWDGLANFYSEIFLPYMIGGAINGLVLAVAGYMLAHPLINAYQVRRSRNLQRRIDARLKRARRVVAE